MRKEPDAAVIWARTWLFGIVPAALAARVGPNALAVRHYRRIVGMLEALGASVGRNA